MCLVILGENHERRNTIRFVVDLAGGFGGRQAAGLHSIGGPAGLAFPFGGHVLTVLALQYGPSYPGGGAFADIRISAFLGAS